MRFRTIKMIILFLFIMGIFLIHSDSTPLKELEIDEETKKLLDVSYEKSILTAVFKKLENAQPLETQHLDNGNGTFRIDIYDKELFREFVKDNISITELSKFSSVNENNEPAVIYTGYDANDTLIYVSLLESGEVAKALTRYDENIIYENWDNTSFSAYERNNTSKVNIDLGPIEIIAIMVFTSLVGLLILVNTKFFKERL
ncbi:hypothetical protein [Chengkuizengella axinellae]|uniref:Uncharacterized protein n=1 Tax=Chengkuizengella axinellae TaxID=3064388 RepID=A0ABT9IY96_9BACL|nr:hypothetical protein [Chengkuizengella sp. 2205SS18-9]MDP5274293.1 hypothetical protein [Chengkuizengella sp. 2205SS18-9]